MTLEEKDPLWEQSASNLRTLLSSAIQDFIRSIELKLPIDELSRKRDRIRSLYDILSPKENVEFDQIVGRHFHTFIGERSANNKSANRI